MSGEIGVDLIRSSDNFTSNSNGRGFVNRFINGDIRIDQRNVGIAQTITAGAALAYTVDRCYAYCTGANVTGQQVAGSTDKLYRYQFTGGASVTAIGFGQRVEAVNSSDLAGHNATISVNIANSLLTTVTWTAYYATTRDTFGTLASPTRTQIATGNWTVSSTENNYQATFAVPSGQTTGIEVVLSVGAQISGTWTINNFQLEKGSVATSFEVRDIISETARCQRYFEIAHSYGLIYATSASSYVFDNIRYKVTKRVIPTIGTPTIITSTNVPLPISVQQINVDSVTIYNNTNAAGVAEFYAIYPISAEL